ncbi:MAG TPA: hypothetical protein VLT47_06700 [Anaeromyxobacteraceae bacterium]|nr:hypothetical protein [Anaeromyxobacteraceae bacterium]
MLSLLAAAALAAVDPCAPVEPAAVPDAAGAAEYRAVAAAEAAAGDPDTAAIAWRRAAALDPSEPTARAALARLCAEVGPRATPSRDPLADGIRALDAGRYAEAAERFRAAREGPERPDAALLEGISRYELGEDAEATRLLRIAEADPAHRETARLYLGLLAWREGAAREAASLFGEASASPAIASLARDLERSARWDSPLLLSFVAEGGYDSNVSLTSDQVAPADKGDAFGGLSALALARPFGANGLFLRGAAAAQEYARLDRYDLTLLEGAVGARWWRDGSGATAEYSLADRTLGGSSYLLTHRLLATGAATFGPFTLTGAWQGRWESYASAYADYSGFLQRADARASVALGPRLRLGAGWGWARDATDLAVLRWSEQGPRADLRLLLGRRSRVAAEAGATFRTYDQHDPGVVYATTAAAGAAQRDVILDGGAAFEHDVGAGVTLRLALLARWSHSNVPAFDYTKVVPSASVGVVFTP